MLIRAGLTANYVEEDLLESEGLGAGSSVAGYIVQASRVTRVYAGAQLFKGAVGDEMTAVDDGDVGTETLDDLEDVRGEEDGSAARDHSLQHRFQSAGGDGVNAFEGLVEEENLAAVGAGESGGGFFRHRGGEGGD